VWDTARGISGANNSRLAWNLSNQEATTDNSVDPHSSGFIVYQDGTTNINVLGANYIFLSMA
jgi:hypothetical protein